jgi:hypothetical protein
VIKRRVAARWLCAAAMVGAAGAALASPDSPAQAMALPGGLHAQVHAGAPRELRLQDSDGAVLKRWPLAAADGRLASGAVQWLHWPARQALVVAPGDLPELWDISLDPHAEDRYDGLVHDYRFGEGVPVRGYLHRRRITLPGPVLAWAPDTAGALLAVVTAPPAAGQSPQVLALASRPAAGCPPPVGRRGRRAVARGTRRHGASPPVSGARRRLTLRRPRGGPLELVQGRWPPWAATMAALP